jgi:hypothetical protein
LSWVVNGKKLPTSGTQILRTAKYMPCLLWTPKKSPSGTQYRASTFILEKWKFLAFVTDLNPDPLASSMVDILNIALKQWLTIAVNAVCYSPDLRPALCIC